MAVLILSLLLSVGYGFLLDDQLPQYSKYGRSLVLVGGAQEDDNAAVYNAIVELSGGVNHAKIGIVVAASGDPPDSCNFYTDIFLNRYKALSVYYVPIDLNHTSGNSDRHVIENIKQQTGFYFGGGDQQRVIDTLFLNNHVPSPALLAIRERHAVGAVIAGSSAGTACQPTAVMVNGGMSWEALRYGAHQTESDDHPDDLVYNKDGGIGFFNGFILDTHFSQRGREGRLIRLLSDTRYVVHGVDWGIGIDEDTALVVTHAGTDQEMGKVIGTHGVFFADVSKSHIDTSTQYFNIDNIMAHFLTTGDSIFLKNKTIMFSSSKSSMTGHQKYDHALTTQDIFGGSRRHPSQKPEFTRVATSIFDSRLDTSSYGDTQENTPRFRVTMSRAVAGAEGYVERKQSFHTDITSYKNLYLKINEV